MAELKHRRATIVALASATLFLVLLLGGLNAFRLGFLHPSSTVQIRNTFPQTHLAIRRLLACDRESRFENRDYSCKESTQRQLMLGNIVLLFFNGFAWPNVLAPRICFLLGNQAHVEEISPARCCSKRR